MIDKSKGKILIEERIGVEVAGVVDEVGSSGGGGEDGGGTIIL